MRARARATFTAIDDHFGLLQASSVLASLSAAWD